MVQNLQNKVILMFAPKFFGYELEIKKELNNLGADVIYFDERPENNFFTKLVLRLNIKFLIQRKINTYFNSIILKTKNNRIDYLFLVNPESIGLNHIKNIKILHKNIEIYTYMWDSIKNKKSSTKYIGVSDKFFTFDPSDIKFNSKIKFLPLFYIEEYEKIVRTNDIKYDISFIGTIHSDRYQIVKKIQIEKLKVFYYFFSPSKILFYLQRVFNKSFKEIEIRDVQFISLKKDVILDIFSKSKAIIDIEHPNQMGLTMRTIEILGAKKKLITTNQNIKDYDFFRHENICIIDRNNPIIPNDFFNIEYKEVPQKIYEEYKLRNWLKKIFLN